MMDDVLQPITNSEDGKAETENRGIRWGRVGVIDRTRASRQNDSDGVMGENFVDRSRAWQDDGEDVLFSYSPRDKLSVLRSEVEDDDRGGFHSSVWQGVARLASAHHGPNGPRIAQVDRQ